MPKDEEQRSETQSDDSIDTTAPSDSQKPHSDETENNLHRAYNLMEKGQYEQASRVFRMIILTDKDNYKAITGYGRCLAEMGMYEDACKYFEKALDINPDYTQASLNLAIYGKR
ncbi:MAG: Tetratricopeptide repeat protein [Candidatus Poribacteria bacterium]|nr:Tetratricopeptide repeat protein [Candidatus Poribacteria bacterium]